MIIELKKKKCLIKTICKRTPHPQNKSLFAQFICPPLGFATLYGARHRGKGEWGGGFKRGIKAVNTLVVGREGLSGAPAVAKHKNTHLGAAFHHQDSAVVPVGTGLGATNQHNRGCFSPISWLRHFWVDPTAKIGEMCENVGFFRGMACATT